MSTTEEQRKPRRLKPVPRTHRLWKKYAEMAADSGHYDLLIELCRLDDRLGDIRKEIQENGITCITTKGRALVHPLLAAEATFSAMYSRLLRVLVTPIRGRGRPLKDEHDSNELAKFRRKRIAEVAKPN